MAVLLPTQILDFTIYHDSTEAKNKIIGAGKELTLPEIVNKTYTYEAPNGDVDLPSMRTENLEQEIPYYMLDADAMSILKLTGVGTLIIRGSYQKLNCESHELSQGGLKITEKGFFKSAGFGKLKAAESMDAKITLTLTYLKIEDQDNSTPLLEIDKLNSTYKVNGVDLLADMNKYL